MPYTIILLVQSRRTLKTMRFYSKSLGPDLIPMCETPENLSLFPEGVICLKAQGALRRLCFHLYLPTLTSSNRFAKHFVLVALQLALEMLFAPVEKCKTLLICLCSCGLSSEAHQGGAQSNRLGQAVQN